VLKAAQIATTEPGPDAVKRIHQRHFVQGMEEVIAGRSVMAQSLFGEDPVGSVAEAMESLSEGQEALRGELALVAERLEALETRPEPALLQPMAAAAGTRSLWLAVGVALVLAVAALVGVLLAAG
jgi:hypothetical protein